jgi:hypothetical protein
MTEEEVARFALQLREAERIRARIAEEALALANSSVDADYGRRFAASKLWGSVGSNHHLYWWTLSRYRREQQDVWQRHRRFDVSLSWQR